MNTDLFSGVPQEGFVFIRGTSALIRVSLWPFACRPLPLAPCAAPPPNVRSHPTAPDSARVGLEAFYGDMSFPLPFWLRRAAVGAMVAVTAACSGDSPSSPNNGGGTTNTLQLNGSTLKVAISATNAARSKGLMGVTTMASDSAMLFVFSDDRQRGFWMKDTPIPLSIVFLDANKKIVFMTDMPPNTTTVYGAFNAPQMRYAVEANQGWFASHGITVGMTASFTLPSGLIVEPDA
jgi:uncharacterized protein